MTVGPMMIEEVTIELINDTRANEVMKIEPMIIESDYFVL